MNELVKVRTRQTTTRQTNEFVNLVELVRRVQRGGGVGWVRLGEVRLD